MTPEFFFVSEAAIAMLLILLAMKVSKMRSIPLFVLASIGTLQSWPLLLLALHREGILGPVFAIGFGLAIWAVAVIALAIVRTEIRERRVRL